MNNILFIKGQIYSQWEDMWVNALENKGFKITVIPILKNRTWFLRWLNNISSWFWNFPLKFGQVLNETYKNMLTKKIIEVVKNNKYEYFIIYNGYNELSIKSLNIIKKNVNKVICIYGDNPFFDSGMKFNILKWLEFNDIALVFDKYQKINFDLYSNINTVLLPAGTDPKLFYPLKPSEEQIKEYGCDLLYVGNSLAGNRIWGDHRARILNSLVNYNLKIFGDSRWVKHFKTYPNLKEVIIFKKLTTEELNIAHNCAKIYIAITNATVVNGVITRVFDAIASGTFIIYEHRDYLFDLFGDLVPTFKTISELHELINYYLRYNEEREKKVNEARKLLLKKYCVSNNIQEIEKYLERQLN